MNAGSNNYFPEMIATLRKEEVVVLYDYILEVSEEECDRVAAFLADEYRREIADIYGAPAFDSEAALWAAKVVYVASQLILYREHSVENMEMLFPSFEGEQTASAALSADLSLRFVPALLYQIQVIDPEDHLITLLDRTLHDWHYSGVAYPLDTERINPAFVADPCWFRLYCDRIVVCRNEKLAAHPFFRQQVLADLGDHANLFWKGLHPAIIDL